jgi:molecular chaperone DnaK (HSP70)
MSNETDKQGRVVGIDLGTTNSLVAFMQGDAPIVIPGEDGSNLVPSVVAVPVAQPGKAVRSRLPTAPSILSSG